ncbi:MAG: hypothetical protein KDH97_18970 [Calditrichaeota bacterium]|nr:hypothetical protein [Calditrichota bacterium]MCB0292345.1 hypothetical protein [Calditrichota bacterium]MCB0304685.1 hypothetical protein [Calditrichota bacterium]MCB0313525.1 hypothetical protein [Calditrichota bacterium]MCB9088055.1 hypothetical protein [Calditrichia bacterium]
MKRLIKALSFLISLLLFSLLPVIPVKTAPVVPDPHYTAGFASIQDLFGVGMLQAGISYRLEWYSVLVILLVILAAIWIGLKAGKAFTN